MCSSDLTLARSEVARRRAEGQAKILQLLKRGPRQVRDLIAALECRETYFRVLVAPLVADGKVRKARYFYTLAGAKPTTESPLGEDVILGLLALAPRDLAELSIRTGRTRHQQATLLYRLKVQGKVIKVDGLWRLKEKEEKDTLTG